MWITWKHQHGHFPRPWTFEQKVEIFRERTIGWQLHIAELIANGGETLDGTEKIAKGIPHAGFAVLSICLSYFEMIARYMAGSTDEDSAGQYFRKGLKAVFPEFVSTHPDIAQVVNQVYKSVRCGLYHGAMTRFGIVLSGAPTSAITLADASHIGLNPHLLPRALRQHFNEYIQKLGDATETTLKRNFERRFDHEYRISQTR